MQPFAADASERPRTALLDTIRDVRAKLAELKVRPQDCRPCRSVAWDDRAIVPFAVGDLTLCALAAHGAEGEDPRAPAAWWELSVAILVDDDALGE